MAFTQSHPEKLHFELSFSPTVELISIVRRFVSAFYKRLIADQDATSRVAMATHELLENACKYSIDGETIIRIEIGEGGSTIRIRLTNRTSPEHIANIRERFALMQSFPDPMAYYKHMMAACIHLEIGSGLGLARLRAEADMKLSLEVDGDRVSIVADTRTTVNDRPKQPA